MPIMIEKNTGKEFPKMAEGLQQLVITQVKDLGLVDTQYGQKPKIRLYFSNAAGETLARSYTKSIHEKATLSKDLKAMTGKAPTESFDAEKLVGFQVQAVVSGYDTGADGKEYANFTFLKAAPGQKVAAPAKSATAAAPAATAAPAAAPNAHGVSITDDDIPF